jgi:hypothetical protein
MRATSQKSVFVAVLAAVAIVDHRVSETFVSPGALAKMIPTNSDGKNNETNGVPNEDQSQNNEVPRTEKAQSQQEEERQQDPLPEGQKASPKGYDEFDNEKLRKALKLPEEFEGVELLGGVMSNKEDIARSRKEAKEFREEDLKKREAQVAARRAEEERIRDEEERIRAEEERERIRAEMELERER